jgi:broad specificity phosphatase PhoE
LLFDQSVPVPERRGLHHPESVLQWRCDLPRGNDAQARFLVRAQVRHLADSGAAVADEIVLVRHGRSAHVHAGWIDLQGFHRWREAYEAAGIVVGETPPPELRALAERAGAVIASNAPRAIESARLLAPEREVITSPLLREMDLSPPALQGWRLPLIGWALAFGIRWLLHPMTSRPHATPAEIDRAREAARWLIGIAEAPGPVVAVTHATFRGLLARALADEGWSCVTRTWRSHHWSAWSFTRQGR